MWMDEVTENPTVGATEVWEMYNTTADAHPMHIHEIAFEVVNRQRLALDSEERSSSRSSWTAAQPPEPWEVRVQRHGHRLPRSGDASPGALQHAGQFVWHCHIVEHEDNEMMRPYRIGPRQLGQPD